MSQEKRYFQICESKGIYSDEDDLFIWKKAPDDLK